MLTLLSVPISPARGRRGRAQRSALHPRRRRVHRLHGGALLCAGIPTMAMATLRRYYSYILWPSLLGQRRNFCLTLILTLTLTLILTSARRWRFSTTCASSTLQTASWRREHAPPRHGAR
eukprot:scaffold17767_cov59-Phaeocystis_antarctica.AAC.1